MILEDFETWSRVKLALSYKTELKKKLSLKHDIPIKLVHEVILIRDQNSQQCNHNNKKENK